ncbi:MAG: deoxynucleoside kinase [Ignavibacteria bacterium]|nr:deoxynucleoside kinase [Ignavibacteria bacterium]
MSDVRYIAVEGVIGAGKTSLARKLSEKLNARLVLEQFELNPFLEKFYSFPERYAFQTQMFFLVNRYQQLQGLHQESLFAEHTVSDYIFDKDRIFAYLTLSEEELKLYDSLFPMLAKSILVPDLIVFLQSDIDRLMHNIRKRNRSMESPIEKSYIQKLSDAYNDFFFRYDRSNLLIIDTSNIDFVENENDFDNIYNEIFREDRAKVEFYKPEGRSIL